MFYICNGTINLLTTTHTFLQWFQNINNEKGEKSKNNSLLYIHTYIQMYGKMDNLTWYTKSLIYSQDLHQ